MSITQGAVRPSLRTCRFIVGGPVLGSDNPASCAAPGQRCHGFDVGFVYDCPGWAMPCFRLKRP